METLLTVRELQMLVFQSSHPFFLFLVKRILYISEYHIVNKQYAASLPRLASSVGIIRISWADSLIATAAWHSCSLCRVCRYMHYKLELQDINTVYLLKRIVLTTIIQLFHWEISQSSL